ncbi:2-hydroxyacyl-CoA dehydratase subunit D [Geoglobus acetivorans]|uniref:2-hydroxyglutaryl-CoA dehydratase subunit HgdA n=1 Tax=Geoglobus acetivorans TaxID=565033 RepID=A0A0A7GG03_GEOAI|nr:2-hydroxyglutaryl-CoA dehydratase subunit HgdA [Geoglobus acetivorans]
MAYWNPIGYKTLYRELFRKHLERQSRLAEKNRPVGWFFSFHPSELIYVFDVIPAFPEQYSAYCAARGSSSDLIDSAISHGYSHFICDYFKTTLGMILEPEKATKPLMPRPDFIVGTRALCVAHHEMADVFARYYGVPRYVINYPYWTSDSLKNLDEVTKEAEWAEELYVEYTIDRLKDLMSFMESVAGPYDEDKFREVFAISEKTSQLLIDTLDLMMSTPTPASQRELGDFVFIAFFVLGSDYAYEFMKKAHEMMKERVKKREGVSDEKHRLLTFGIMPWHTLSLYEYCERNGANFPVNLYVNASVHRVDASKPLESMVRRSMHVTNSGYEMLDSVVRTAKKADIDGALLLENTGCRITSMIVRPLAKVLQEELGISSLILEAPQCDPRLMPLERAKNLIDAYLESIS